MVSRPLAEAKTKHEENEEERQRGVSAHVGKLCLKVGKRQTESKVALEKEPKKQVERRGLK